MERVEEPTPEPPDLGPLWHLLAVTIELGVLARFLSTGDYVGLVLCASYAWWSATWAMCARTIRGS